MNDLGEAGDAAEITFSTMPAPTEHGAMALGSSFLDRPQPSASRHPASTQGYGRFRPVFHAVASNDLTYSASVFNDPLFDEVSPPAPSPKFRGHTKELEYMDTFFRQRSNNELILRGITRSDNTQLALKFAQVTTIYRQVKVVFRATAVYLTICP